MNELVQCYRLVTFVPPEHAPALAKKISALIPPFGRYDHVAWWSATGTEQFRPLEGANPAAGKTGEITRSPSVRLEFSLPRDEALLGRLIRALQKGHPWEKPVIMVFEHSLATAG